MPCLSGFKQYSRWVPLTNISFTKTVAVSLNEAVPFASRNSIMDDTEAMEFLELAFSK